MTVYVNMHGSGRLTLRQAQALQTVINLGMADAEALVHDGDHNGVITSAEYGVAQDAAQKLWNATWDAEQRAKDKAGRLCSEEPGQQHAFLRCSPCNRIAEADGAGAWLCPDCGSKISETEA